MANAKTKYYDAEAVLQLAREHGVDTNPLFIQTLKNYETVQRSIELVNNIVSSCDGELIVSKQYVKGRENVYMNPAVKELPKFIEASNKTLDKLVMIIKEFGAGSGTKDELLEFLSSR